MFYSLLCIILAFYWLLTETKFLSVRFLAGKELVIHQAVKAGILSKELKHDATYLPVKTLQANLKTLLNTELVLDGFKSKPKAVKVGYGIYNAKMVKELISLIPANADISFKSIPSKPAYNQPFGDGYIKHEAEPAKLECVWVNGSKGKWVLNSGYDVKYYVVQSATLKAWKKVKYNDLEPIPDGKGLSVLAVDIPIFS